MLLKNMILVVALMGLSHSIYAENLVSASADSKTIPMQRSETIVLDDQVALQACNEVYRALETRQLQQALEKLKIAQNYFKQQTQTSKQRLFASQTLPEQMMYLLQASNENQSAQVISYAWAELYYLEAFIWIEYSQYQNAQLAIQNAVALAPFNSKYLKEQGFILQYNKAWAEALTVLKQAEEHLNLRAPQEVEQLHPIILRSIGVTLIELNRLDEAKIYFQHALKINAQDQKALSELEYIQQLEQQADTNKRATGRV